MIRKVLFGCLLYLAGCAVLPDRFYRAPYPEFLLQKADKWVTSVSYVSEGELLAKCALGDEPKNGCAKMTTGQIYILTGYGSEFEYCVLQHERSHFYDLYVLHTSLPDTQSHKGWIKTDCYRPRITGRTGIFATVR